MAKFAIGEEVTIVNSDIVNVDFRGIRARIVGIDSTASAGRYLISCFDNKGRSYNGIYANENQLRSLYYPESEEG